MLGIKINAIPLFSVKLFTIILVLLSLAVPLSAQADSQPAPESNGTSYIQFCPKGKPYEDPSCSDKRTEIDDAISDAITAAQNKVSGTIYIEAGSFSSTYGEITLSHFDYGTSLVIQGGVGGGTTTFTRQLKIDNNAGLDLTVKDVTVQTTAPTEHGININSSTGKVLLDGVTVQDSTRNGIFVNAHTGDITMQNVIVDNSNDTNIEIYAIEGSVYLNQVTSTNSQTGLGVTLSDVRGKKGAILTDVTAQDNFANNIYFNGITADATIIDSTVSGSVNGDGISITAVHGKKGVIIENTSSNTNNGSNFYITYIDNSVSMENVTANGSTGGPGIYLLGISGKKGAALNTVTANGNNSFNLYFSDFESNVTLSNIIANSAGGKGLFMTNIRGTKGVTISDSTVSTSNDHNIHLNGITNGSASLTNVTANDSVGGEGIFLENIGGKKGVKFSNVTANTNNSYNIQAQYITGDFSFKTGEASNSVTNSGIYLYHIDGNKGISISGVEASSNAAMNVSITTITGNVNFSGVIANNSVNNRGINIINVNGSKGVTLKGVTADGNYNRNINLYNIFGNATLSNISAQNCDLEEGFVINLLAGSKGIVLSGANTSGNWKDGMYFYDITGNIKMKGVESNNNYGAGINLSNIDGSSGISLANVTAQNNTSTNIYAFNVDGNASLKTITADDSKSGYGVRMVTVSGAKGVTMSDVTAIGNESVNVNLETVISNVTLKNITADGSVSSSGLVLTNILGSKGIKGSNIAASTNGSFNIYFNNINGDVALSGITATNGGTGGGGYIRNIYGSKGVTIKTADFSGANQTNLEVHTVNGFAVLSDVTASSSVNGNGLNAIDVDGILMIMNSTFNNNSFTGINVSNQNGQISINNVEAKGNLVGNGGQLYSMNNQLVCDSEFSDNGSYGIKSSANGQSITLSNVTFSNNTSGDTDLVGSIVKNTSTKCKVIPAPAP